MPSRKISERLFLLDGMALAYRAYFSFITRPLINSKGENTSAIFGFANTLMKILNDEGINIARRTVAKYRDELNIPSSTDRKQIF